MVNIRSMINRRDRLRCWTIRGHYGAGHLEFCPLWLYRCNTTMIWLHHKTDMLLSSNHLCVCMCVLPALNAMSRCRLLAMHPSWCVGARGLVRVCLCHTKKDSCPSVAAPHQWWVPITSRGFAENIVCKRLNTHYPKRRSRIQTFWEQEENFEWHQAR